MGKPRRPAVQRDLLPGPHPEIRVIPTRQYRESLAELPANVQHVVKRKVDLLQSDRSYPGLNAHRMERMREDDIWSCYAGRGYRVLFRFESAPDGTEDLRLIDVGTHALIDRYRN